MVNDVQAVNISGQDCLTASLWITGVDGTYVCAQARELRGGEELYQYSVKLILLMCFPNYWLTSHERYMYSSMSCCRISKVSCIV